MRERESIKREHGEREVRERERASRERELTWEILGSTKWDGTYRSQH